MSSSHSTPTAITPSSTRNLGNIVMDQNNVERVELDALGGADRFDIGDLRATDIRELNINLAGVAGGGADGREDVVNLTGGALWRVHQSSALREMTWRSAAWRRRRASRTWMTRRQGHGAVAAAVRISSMPCPSARGLAALTLEGGSGNDILDRQRWQ